MHRAVKIFLVCIALMEYGNSISCDAAIKGKMTSDSAIIRKKEKNAFVTTLLKPLKWIGRNWKAYDPLYSTPSFYNWVGQFQNTSSIEMMRINQKDMMDLVVRSKWSHKIGPGIGYRFLYYGYTVDLNAIKGTNRRSELAIALNSNLVNVDFIRRRTGGDFMFKRWKTGSGEASNDYIHDWGIDESFLDDLDENLRYDVTGFNIYFFTNHRKYSNPAAFSNGAIQLRSVGSPILGIGYLHHKITMPFTERLSLTGAQYLVDGNGTLVSDINFDYEDLEYDWESIYSDKVQLLKDFIVKNQQYIKLKDRNKEANNLIFNNLPSKTKIEDWHLNLGYAYNLVFSKRIILALSAVMSPSLKFIHLTNNGSPAAEVAKYPEIQAIIKEIGLDNDNDVRSTHLGVNAIGRAALTYNLNRWRIGMRSDVSYYLFHNKDLTINNGYGSVVIYVGYGFGRKKQYRWRGMNREAFITIGMTKRQREAMRDTVAAGSCDSIYLKRCEEMEKRE